MNLRARSRTWSRLLVWLLALPLGGAFLLGGPFSFSAYASPQSITHLTDTTRAEAGRSRVIAFEVNEAATEDTELPYTLSQPERLRVLDAPRISKGHRLGYVRVEGIKAGVCVLEISGAKLRIEVAAATNVDPVTPYIIGPSTGARAWGTFNVGVEIRKVRGQALPKIELRTRDNKTFTESERYEDLATHLHVMFQLDGAKFQPGQVFLTPVAVYPDGSEQAGPTTLIHVLHPTDAEIQGGEAEADYEMERPQRFRDDRKNVGQHEEASGGKFFANYSAYPAFCFPVSVPENGFYQAMVTVAGTRGQGILPTVELFVDDNNLSSTNGRLLRGDWHRIALGIPIYLEAGEHALTPFFANDFYVPNVCDRNLFIDRIQVVRVADVDGGAGGKQEAPEASAELQAAIDDPLGARTTPLRVAFVRPLQGQIVPGLLEITGTCWWSELESQPAPLVKLEINGQTVQSQRSGAPKFWVDAAHFEPGPNTIRLIAEGRHGWIARTPLQTMSWDGSEALSREPRQHYRFSIHDERWDPSIRERLQNKHNPAERVTAAFYSQTTISLELPEAIEGRHRVYVHARGDVYQGRPLARVTVHQGEEATVVGDVEAPNWWQLRPAGEIDLLPGAKRITVQFINDKYDAGKGDRNLYVDAIRLAPVNTEPDRVAPTVALTYPPNGTTVQEADAVVVEAFDDRALVRAELLLNGEKTGIVHPLHMQPGRFVLPVLLRGVAPGAHTVAVRVDDQAGNSTLSEPRTIEVVESNSLTRYQRAVHLLNRFAYGPDPDQLAQLLTVGEESWLRENLKGVLSEPGELAAMATHFPYFHARRNYEVPRRAIAHLMHTQNPSRTRFVHWAQNHFSTWIRKIQGSRKWSEHLTFLRMGVSSFDRLLFASAESPAMLAYLDQERSFAGRINENYAREVMELHTLGVKGGYDQSDVTELAQLLTGWTASTEGDGREAGLEGRSYTFRFATHLSDGGERRILGAVFKEANPEERYDRVRHALELLAHHPSTAEYVCTKLVEHYVAKPAPPAVTQALRTRFLETGGDLAEVLQTMAQHPDFWESRRQPRVTHALDYAVRISRCSQHYQPWQVGTFLERCGKGLFDRETPDGYPEDDPEQTDTNIMLQRWKLARDSQWALVKLVPHTWRSGRAAQQPGWAQRVVDVLAIRLTGRLLGETSNAAALEVAAGEGHPGERARIIATTIAQLPEANLR